MSDDDELIAPTTGYAAGLFGMVVSSGEAVGLGPPAAPIAVDDREAKHGAAFISP